jgi:hypothetical protein
MFEDKKNFYTFANHSKGWKQKADIAQLARAADL